jgi:fatty-acyl-CoA synthase
MQTLTERIEAAAARAPGGAGGTITFLSGDTGVTVPWTEIHQDATGMAAALQARGIGPGDHVAVLGPTSRPLVTLVQATWLAGATIVILPLPMRLASIEEFVVQTRARIRRADTALLVLDADLAPFIESEEGDPRQVLLDDLAAEGARLGPDRLMRTEPDPDALAVLQFTSGSTSEPKGVMLPHRVFCANLDGIAERGRLDVANDVLVSWLPLYHDMGLVGMLGTSMTTATTLVLGAPQDFTSRPARWMEWVSTYGGTVTAGPNFAYALAARHLGRSGPLRLGTLRIAINGAEPIDPGTMRTFVEAGARHGLRPGAVFPAFGMAEVAIAGTFPDPGEGLTVDLVDRRVLETERYAAPAETGADHAKEYVRLGRAIAGLELRVVEPSSGTVLADREVGELEIRGTSVTPGYYRDPEATGALFRDGWLRTGDLAYLLDGELVLCGRIKDVIIAGGRNIFPEDVERAAGGIPGVRPGNVIVFGVDGTRGETMVVVAETRPGEQAAGPERVRRELADVAKRVSGLPPREVVLLPPGSLPKTSSGKLQRSLCRTRYLDGNLDKDAIGAT